MHGGAWPGLRAHVVCFRGIHLPHNSSSMR
jgi:hypothetical protein